jgi:hypothetical protein
MAVGGKLKGEIVGIQLGCTYRDKITRFEGVATGYVVYITGCNQVLLAPPVDSDGKLREAQWIDEQRLDEQVADPIVLNNSSSTGFDKAAPKR